MELSRFHGCVVHAYYSAHHYARALLISEGLETKTHSGLIHLLHLHFVREGRFSSDTAGLLSWLQSERERASYDAAATFTETQAREALLCAEEFAQQARQALRSAGYLDLAE